MPRKSTSSSTARPSPMFKSRAGWQSLTWFRAASCSSTRSQPSRPASTALPIPFSLSWKRRKPRKRAVAYRRLQAFERRSKHTAMPVQTSFRSMLTRWTWERRMRTKRKIQSKWPLWPTKTQPKSKRRCCRYQLRRRRTMGGPSKQQLVTNLLSRMRRRLEIR